MKKLLIAAFAFVAFAGCSNSDDDNIVTNGNDPKVEATTFKVAAPSSAADGTRVAVSTKFTTNGLVFDWQLNDEVTVYKGNDLLGDFKVKEITDGVATLGTDDNSLTLTEGDNYTVVYPKSSSATLDARNTEELLSNQTISQAAQSLANTVRMSSSFAFSTASAVELEHECAVMVYMFSSASSPVGVKINDGANEYNVAYESTPTIDSWYIAYVAIKPNSGSRNLKLTTLLSDSEELTFNASTEVAYEAGKYYTAVTADGLYVFKAAAIDRIVSSNPSVEFKKSTDTDGVVTIKGFSPAEAMAAMIACDLVIPVQYTENAGVITFAAASALALEPETVNPQYDMTGSEMLNTKGTIAADGTAWVSTTLMSPGMNEGDPATPYQIAYNGIATVTDDSTAESSTVNGQLPNITMGGAAW